MSLFDTPRTKVPLPINPNDTLPGLFTAAVTAVTTHPDLADAIAAVPDKIQGRTRHATVVAVIAGWVAVTVHQGKHPPPDTLLDGLTNGALDAATLALAGVPAGAQITAAKIGYTRKLFLAAYGARSLRHVPALAYLARIG